MPSVPPPPPEPSPRGPCNQLHQAAQDGSVERTLALLSGGSIDINQGTPDGWTPLMYATDEGCSRVVRILLDNGAKINLVADGGFDALSRAAMGGHLRVVKALLTAGANLEGITASLSVTALHLAVAFGHTEVVSELIEEGANPNARRPRDGGTALALASSGGYVGIVKLLLRAKADPSLGRTTPSGRIFVPLDDAAQEGHSDVVRELLQQVGINGCCALHGGRNALSLAATHQHLGIVAMLVDAGVVDAGEALICAARTGHEASVKFLLERQGTVNTMGIVDYVNARNSRGVTPLFGSVNVYADQLCSLRIMRLFLNAGADATSAILLTNPAHQIIMFDDILDLTTDLLCANIDGGGKPATDEQRHRLEAARRLLLQVEAVHAVSWLWASDDLSTTHGAEVASRSEVTPTTGTPLGMVLPILQRRTQRHGVVLAALTRRYPMKL